MMAYQCAFESMRHPRSNDGSHVKIRSIPVIFKQFEKKFMLFTAVLHTNSYWGMLRNFMVSTLEMFERFFKRSENRQFRSV